jgi:hypothetical protein
MDNISLDPQQIQQMIQLLQAMLPPAGQPSTTTDGTDNSTTPPKRKPRKKTANSATHDIKAKPLRENKFDQMAELNMHREDIAVDKKLAIQPPVPRARKFRMLKATCRVCGRTEDINPVLITDSLDRYKCNKCSAGAG